MGLMLIGHDEGRGSRKETRAFRVRIKGGV